MKRTYRYRAFISYSHRDKKFAKWLHRRIENYTIPTSLRENYSHLPKNLKRSIFRDEEELNSSASLGKHILMALRDSRRLIVVCSPSSATSQWVDREIKTFKEIDGEDRVLAIIKSGEPYASMSKFYDSELEAFPKALRYVLGTDGELSQEETEPLASDARRYRDREMALMKIIASILGVSFADLWDREQRERLKKRAIFIAIFSLFFILLLYSSIQWFVQKESIALEELDHKIATTRYSIRHNNLSTKEIIEQNHKLNEYREIKKRKEETQKIFSKVKTPLVAETKKIYDSKGVESAIDFLRSSQTLSQREQRRKDLSLDDTVLAKLYIENREFKRAKDSFESAIGIFFDYDNVLEYANFLNTQNSYKRAIDLYEELYQKGLCEENEDKVLNNLANLYLKEHRYLLAEKYYQKALRISKKLPQYGDISIAMIVTNLGRVYERLDRSKESEIYYNKALAIYKKLKKIDTIKYYDYMGKIYDNLGHLYSHIGELKKADCAYQRSLDIKLSAKNESDSAIVKYRNSDIYHADIANTLNNQGILYLQIGELDRAKEAFYRALLKRERLSKNNPEAYTSALGDTLNNLANLYIIMDSTKDVELYYLKALRIYRDLSDLDLKVYSLRLATVYNNLGFFYRKIEKFKRAKESFLQAVSIYRTLDNSNTDLSKVLNELGSLHYMRFKNMDIASRYYTEALRYDPKNSLAFNNLYELSLITNREINSSLEEQFVSIFKDTPKEFMIYEMLKIFKYKNIDQENQVDKWDKKYDKIPIDWGFEELEEWVKGRDETLHDIVDHFKNRGGIMESQVESTPY